MPKSRNKILFLDQLIKTVRELQKAGKKIVQSHGVFDLIHPGVIQHLKSAKERGDVLIVTIIRGRDVKLGPGRPVFPEKYRAESVASISLVDYLCVVDDTIPFECVRKIGPDIFARGEPFNERDIKVHGKIFEEEREKYFGKSEIYETNGVSFSSTDLLSQLLDLYPPETKIFLANFSRKYSFRIVADKLESLKSMKVLLIGDGIIDEYHYCSTMGKSAKSSHVVNKYLIHEVFAGGTFAVANHIAGICDEVHMVSLLGRENSREEFISNHLKSNVSARYFYRDDGPTVVKKRYIDYYRLQKLFEINYLEQNYIEGECEREIISYLESVFDKFDLVLVCDFGHGFITAKIINAIERGSKKYAVNTQTNAANTGFNMITKYHKPPFVCLDQTEVRLALQDQFSDSEVLARKIREKTEAETLIITLGKNGSIGIDKSGKIDKTPIFSTKVVDTIGAGDAFFAYTAPCFSKGFPLELISFIGNAVGALAVGIVGNKAAVEKRELLAFIYSILR